jgi:hypothetical protein
MDRSLHPPLLQNRACHFHGTRLLSVVMRVTHTDWQVVPPWLGQSAFGGGRYDALPGRHQGLALCLGSSPLTHSLTFHNTVLTSAYPGHYPGPWLLEGSCPIRHAVGTYSDLCRRARMRLLRSQLPLLASLGRCFPPGFSAVHTGQFTGCRRLILCLVAPARQPLTLVRFHDGSTTPSLALPIDACSTGYPD